MIFKISFRLKNVSGHIDLKSLRVFLVFFSSESPSHQPLFLCCVLPVLTLYCLVTVITLCCLFPVITFVPLLCVCHSSSSVVCRVLTVITHYCCLPVIPLYCLLSVITLCCLYPIITLCPSVVLPVITLCCVLPVHSIAVLSFQ